MGAIRAYGVNLECFYRFLRVWLSDLRNARWVDSRMVFAVDVSRVCYRCEKRRVFYLARYYLSVGCLAHFAN